MKKGLILYLIFNFWVLSLPSSYTISIFKLGGLITHFHEHRHDGSKTNFFSFLASHYLEKKHHDADHADHEKLPFHDHHGENVNFASQTPSLQPENHYDIDFPKQIISTSKVIASVTSDHASSYLDDIWQPPKA